MPHRRGVWFRVNLSLFLLGHVWETCPGLLFGRPNRRYTSISNPSTLPCPPITPSLSPPARSLRPDLGCTAQATLSPLVATRLRNDVSHVFSLNDTFSARLPATDHLLYCLSFYSIEHLASFIGILLHCTITITQSIDTLNPVYVRLSTITFLNP